MLDQTTRSAVLRLRENGHGTRSIARTLGISRGAVRSVLQAGSAEVPPLERAEKADPFRTEIAELYRECKGNWVRVHEKLLEAGATLSYQALTAFCRRHGIGHEPVKPAGRYHFKPGEEMQHDTSPHDVNLGGKLRRVQTASLVLCHSRMIFIQLYPNFTRFTCKLFLADALRYLGGTAKRCLIDNTHVVVLRGTGKEMIPVPEMAAFADRFGFAFAAHEKGDANRSARVERPFDFIENNFLAGRDFRDFDDLNRQAIAWCDRVNATRKRHLHASARELFAAEQPHLLLLPLWVPEVYLLHHRIVDVEGYVWVNRHKYSAPYSLIGRQVEVRETKEQIQIFQGPRLLGSHQKVLDSGYGQRSTLPEHRPPRGQGGPPPAPQVEERQLLEAAPEIEDYVKALKQRATGRGTLAFRRLFRLLREYPRTAVIDAIRTAAQYGLFDLDRLERMVLRRIAKDFSPSATRRTPLNDEIEQLLKNLHLTRIAEILDQEIFQAEKKQVSYQDFLAILLRAQWYHRQETALAYRIRKAGLPEQWTLESFPWKRQPGVSQRQFRGFAELDFIGKAENIVLIGPTGVGKTGLACGLLLKALQNGYRGIFLRAQDLFDEMYASLADRSSRKLIDRLARVDLLCIDEMGYLNLRPEQTNIFFKLMELESATKWLAGE